MCSEGTAQVGSLVQSNMTAASCSCVSKASEFHCDQDSPRCTSGMERRPWSLGAQSKECNNEGQVKFWLSTFRESAWAYFPTLKWRNCKQVTQSTSHPARAVGYCRLNLESIDRAKKKGSLTKRQPSMSWNEDWHGTILLGMLWPGKRRQKVSGYRSTI
jgi:hypothetical protein